MDEEDSTRGRSVIVLQIERTIHSPLSRPTSSSFEEKMATLHAQLQRLEDGGPTSTPLAVFFSCVAVLVVGVDPEYLQEVARVQEERDKRLFVAESFRVYETQCVKEEFEREKTQAETEFEVRTQYMQHTHQHAHPSHLHNCEDVLQ